jgi:hypothetical protein
MENKTGPISRRIVDEVSSWPGVEVDAEERGEISFKVGRREIGHLHGDHVAHFSFPRTTWAELMAQHRIVAHPVFPDKRGPAERRIESDADVVDVIDLLRFNYERMASSHSSGSDAA